MIGILIYSQSEAAVDTIDAHGRETKEKRMNFLQRSKTELSSVKAMLISHKKMH